MGELFLNRKDFFLNCFFKWAKLAKFIRFEAAGKLMWDTRCELKGASISITKFTELGWNDGVFVHIEEHQRCSGKRTGFFLFLWILIIFIRKDFLYFLYVLRKQSWRNSFALKRCGNWCGMRYEMRVFLSQSSRRWCEMMAFLRALRNIGDVLDV